MAAYKYRARLSSGELVTGVIDASDIRHVKKELLEKGLYPFEIKERTVSRDFSLKISSKVTLRDIAVFCRQLAALLKAGVSISISLDILVNQLENSRLKNALSEISVDVRKGKTLSDSMSRYPDIFPMLLCRMVEAGEVSGTLDDIIDRMAVHFENQNKVHQKIKSSLTYPIMVACVATGVVIFLITYVLPTFLSLFQTAGATLPGPTRLLLGISSFLRKSWYLILVLMAGGYLSLKKYISSKEGKERIDSLKMKLPAIGPLYVKILTAQFTRTLSILIKSGIPVLKAIDVADKVMGNSSVSKALSVVSQELSRGAGLSGPLKASGIFPPMVYQLVEVGESSGTLDDMLASIADFFDQEVEAATVRFTTMLEPAIILFMAVVVGFIVISIAMPMFQLINQVGH